MAGSDSTRAEQKSLDIVLGAVLGLWCVLTILSLPLYSGTQGRRSPAISLDHLPEPNIIESRFEERITRYKEDLSTLTTNLKLQALLVALALVLSVRRKKDDEDIGGLFDLKLPPVLWYWVIPIAGVYLWVHFGYVFDRVIENRLALWDLLKLAHDPGDGSVLSRTDLLRDTGLVDLYFIEFQPTRHGIEIRGFEHLPRIELALYALLLAATHAAILGTLWIGFEGRVGRLKSILAFALMLFLLWASHVQFYASYHHNWVQAGLLIVAMLLTFVLVGLHRRRQRALESTLAPVPSVDDPFVC